MQLVKPVPYIGVTDLNSLFQIEHVLGLYKQHVSSQSLRKFHVGIMMTRKTLCNIPCEWQSIFPPNEAITNLLSFDDACNCLYYADYTKDSPCLHEDLLLAISYGGPGLNAIQLDMVWPDPDEVATAVAGSGKKIEVILQVGERAFDQIDHDPAALVKRLKAYDGVVHRVLLDKSMGSGKEMNAEFLLPFALAVNTQLPAMALVAASGLGPGSRHLIAPLAKVFPDISPDAQGRLRRSRNIHDPIDLDLVDQYVVEMLQVLP